MTLHGFVVAAIICFGVWLVAIGCLLVIGRRFAARELAALIPNLVKLFRGLLRDPRLPRRTKIWIGIGVLWLLSPIDLVPEFIPVLGPLDDAVVAALILRHVAKVAGPSLLIDHWKGEPATLQRIMRILRIKSFAAGPPPL